MTEASDLFITLGTNLVTSSEVDACTIAWLESDGAILLELCVIINVSSILGLDVYKGINSHISINQLGTIAHAKGHLAENGSGRRGKDGSQ